MCIIINYTITTKCQRDLHVVGHFTLLYYKYTAESVLKEFLKSLNIWQSYGGKVDCLKHSVCQGSCLAERCRTHL